MKYFESIIPEPVRVLGLTMRPLSIGRYRLMKRFDVAFVADGPQQATGEDLILGVAICSMRCDEFMELASNPKRFQKELRKWGKKVCGSRWFGRLFGKGFDFLEKVLLFKNYIESALHVPQCIELEESQPSSAHWTQSFEVVLRSKLNWSAEEINEAPLSKAIADYYKWGESEGHIRLVTDEEVAAASANAQVMEAAVKAAEDAKLN